MSDQVAADAASSEAPQNSSSRAYEEVKADMIKYKQQLRAMAEEKEKLLEEKKSLETKNLQDQNQYKTLYEKVNEENKTLKDSVSKMKNNFIQNEKIREIEAKALSHGLKPKALDLFRKIAAESDDVLVEITNTGRTQVVGVDGFIERAKAEYGDVLFFDGRAPNVNTNLPNTQVTPKTWTGRELLELQKKDPAQYAKVMQERISKRS